MQTSVSMVYANGEAVKSLFLDNVLLNRIGIGCLGDHLNLLSWLLRLTKMYRQLSNTLPYQP